MTDAATTPPSAAQQQTRRQAGELRALLPLVESMADQVAELHQERRIDETAALLFDAAKHLARAWSLLAKAYELADEAGRSSTSLTAEG